MDDRDSVGRRFVSHLMQDPQGARLLPPPPVSRAPDGSSLPPTLPPMDTVDLAPPSVRRYTRRVVNPSHYLARPMSGMTYGGAYGNGYNPYGGSYSPYNGYPSGMQNQFQNPAIIAAAENSRPAFDSIQAVVQSFSAVSMMLDSTFNAMQMSFEALLGVAENFTRLRSFMVKLYSTMISFKVARLFLAKLLYLIRMVRGQKGEATPEEMWASLSSTSPQGAGSEGRSWPLFVFTGLVVACPYFLYKLLNSTVPVQKAVPKPTPLANHVPSSAGASTTTSTKKPPSHFVMFTAKHDWDTGMPNTVALEKGQVYYTTSTRLERSASNGGWVLVDSATKYKGYIPLAVFKTHAQVLPPRNCASETFVDYPNNVNNGPAVIPRAQDSYDFNPDPNN